MCIYHGYLNPVGVNKIRNVRYGQIVLLRQIRPFVRFKLDEVEAALTMESYRRVTFMHGDMPIRDGVYMIWPTPIRRKSKQETRATNLPFPRLGVLPKQVNYDLLKYL